MYIYIYMYRYTFIHMYICIYMYMYIYMHHACIIHFLPSARHDTHTHTHSHTQMCTFIHIYMYIYTHTYIHIHIYLRHPFPLLCATSAQPTQSGRNSRKSASTPMAYNKNVVASRHLRKGLVDILKRSGAGRCSFW